MEGIARGMEDLANCMIIAIPLALIGAGVVIWWTIKGGIWLYGVLF